MPATPEQIDDILTRIEKGESEADIESAIGVARSTFRHWLTLTPELVARSARAKEASAESWLDRGLDPLRKALQKDSGIDPSAARAYAQECARRAAIRNPAYRDKTSTEVSGTLRVKTEKDLSDDELAGIASSGSG